MTRQLKIEYLISYVELRASDVLLDEYWQRKQIRAMSSNMNIISGMKIDVFCGNYNFTFTRNYIKIFVFLIIFCVYAYSPFKLAK